MQNHGIPVRVLELSGNVPRDVIVHFCKVLLCSIQPLSPTMLDPDVLPTDTKKLVVPSALSKVFGKSFSQVSSPYMTSFPAPFAFICASHVSCEAKLELSSVSSRLRMTSRKEGMDPVVMALSRGIVTVGDVAWAVKGKAAPSRIKLERTVSDWDSVAPALWELTTGYIENHSLLRTQNH